MSGKDTVIRIQTPHGIFFIDSERDKKMADALQRGAYPNETLLEIAEAFVNKESIVVDVGAHIGSFAIPMAKVARKVIAFEPSRETFSLLSRNADENGASLQLINKGLGSENGSGTLVVRNTSNAGANTLVSNGDIPITTLDSELSNIDFIKMDVEGMELDVLRGGAALIERARPTVFFEVNLSQLRAHGAYPRALERFFAKYHYQLYFPLKQEKLVLARVRSVTLLTALIAPRAWIFFGESAPFDLLAVPKEQPLPLQSVGFIRALHSVISNNITVKNKRIATFLRRIF